jgi:hypothetical protein
VEVAQDQDRDYGHARNPDQTDPGEDDLELASPPAKFPDPEAGGETGQADRAGKAENDGHQDLEPQVVLPVKGCR